MKTLKQLKSQCVLIASFSQPAFVFDGMPANFYIRPTKALLFYDNIGSYYLYTYISNVRIRQFNDKSSAVHSFLSFSSNMLY